MGKEKYLTREVLEKMGIYLEDSADIDDKDIGDDYEVSYLTADDIPDYIFEENQEE